LWLFALAIVVSAPDRRAFVGLIAFTAGHALALVGADLGLRLPAESFASVWIAVACVLVFAARVRGAMNPRGFDAVFLAAGTLSGLPVSAPSAANTTLVTLFNHNLGTELAIWAMASGLLAVAAIFVRAGVRSPAHSKQEYEAAPRAAGSWARLGFTVAGVLSVVLGASAFRASLRPPALEPASIFSTAAEAEAIQRRSASVPLFQRLDDPAVAFLNLESDQLRIEILLRVKDLESWLGREFVLGDTLAPERQEPLLKEISRRIQNGFVLTLDGRELNPSVTQSEFVSIDPSGILSRAVPVVETVDEARVGLKWIYELSRAPHELSFRWQLFSAGLKQLSVNSTTPTQNAQAVLSPEAPVYHLQLDPARLALPSVERVRVRARSWPLVSALLVLFAGALMLARKLKKINGLRQKLSIWTIALSLLLAYGLYPFARVEARALPARLDESQARGVLEQLLRNLYHSFDLHTESAIYDRLAASVEGDQLEKIYLASRRALELQRRGGARARVDKVRILDIKSVKSLGEGRFEIDALWSISGSVNHFGHTHYRQNRNHALVDLAPVDGVWKITKIKVLDEERVL
jgi:hypothetical protein